MTMKSRNKKNKRGFTLIELVVVLAILAIIAAIAVPLAFGSIEKSKTSACAASRDSLQSALRVESALSKLESGTLTQAQAAEVLQTAVADCGLTLANGKITGGCPKDGVYTVSFDVAAQVFSIRCSVAKHNGTETEPSKEFGIDDILNILCGSSTDFRDAEKLKKNCSAFYDAIEAKINKTTGEVPRSVEVHSTATEDGTVAKAIQAALKEQNVDLNNISWTLALTPNKGAGNVYNSVQDYLNNSARYRIYVADTAITAADIGTTVNVVCYELNADGTLTKRNGTMEVSKHSTGGYPILAEGAFKG